MAKISHQKARYLLMLATDSSLPSQDELALEAHLEACKECQTYRQTLTDTQQKLRSSLRRRWDTARINISVQKIQTDSRRTIMFNKITMTISALALIAIVVFTSVMLTNNAASQHADVDNSAAGIRQLPTYTPNPSPTPAAIIYPITGLGACRSDPVIYTVQEDDTLVYIADKYGVSIQSIIELNNLNANSAVIFTEQELLIPLSTDTPSVDPVDATKFTWPLPQHYLSGQDYNNAHSGIDIAGEAGEDVLAASSGRVIFAGEADHGLGNTVVLEHNANFTTVYAYLAEVRVSCQEVVLAGDVIGLLLGETEESPSLHFEIRLADIPKNPWTFLPP